MKIISDEKLLELLGDAWQIGFDTAAQNFFENEGDIEDSRNDFVNKLREEI